MHAEKLLQDLTNVQGKAIILIVPFLPVMLS